MAQQLDGTDEAEITVHTAHDKVGVIVGGHIVWLTLAEVNALRHRLMMATREILTYNPAHDVPEPRRR